MRISKNILIVVLSVFALLLYFDAQFGLLGLNAVLTRAGVSESFKVFTMFSVLVLYICAELFVGWKYNKKLNAHSATSSS